MESFRNLMLIAAAALAIQGDPQLVQSINAKGAGLNIGDLTIEQWEGKFKFMDEWSHVYGCQSTAARAFPAVKLQTLRDRYKSRDSPRKNVAHLHASRRR
jgi:hypothetical protein